MNPFTYSLNRKRSPREAYSSQTTSQRLRIEVILMDSRVVHPFLHLLRVERVISQGMTTTRMNNVRRKRDVTGGKAPFRRVGQAIFRVV